MTATFIPPIDTFRIVLRAIYPANPRLPARIKSTRYFERAQKKYKFHPPKVGEATYDYQEDAGPPPAHAWKPLEALRVLRHGVSQRKISLQGERGTEPPAMIPVQHCAEGDFDVWNATLAIGPLVRPDYFYRRVWCARDDVLAIIGKQSNASLSPREAAELAINACYPDGVPRDVVPAVLCRAIGNWIKAHLPNMVEISDSTIKRAAGRKK